MTYADRPWIALYRNDVPSDIEVEHPTMLAMLAAAVRSDPDAAAVKYFDRQLSFRELDRQSDALARALRAGGLKRGDRVALFLQNVPQFVVAVAGIWKAGGAAVSINPMNRERELGYQLEDSGASVLIALEGLYDSVGRNVVANSPVKRVITTSELEYQSRNDSRVFEGIVKKNLDTEDFATLIENHSVGDPITTDIAPEDIAVLTYTSGTTGPPKGAMTSHSNMTFNAQVYRDWLGLNSEDTVLGVAPLFHITGLIGHVAASILVRMPLVLAYRFHPEVMLDAIREHRPTFTVGAITAFTALLNTPGCVPEDFTSMRLLYSGGAPISPTAAEAVRAMTGVALHNIYGLTETTSPTHAVPVGAHTPVDPTSGALSVGVPVPNTVVRIEDEKGAVLPVGEIGELVVRGPQVVRGYWNKPEESASAIRDGWFHTGDVGFMDEAGWFYVVDRKKDMIVASGYKVWPREVEDVLAEHPAVREAAVVGIPDEYRGETVKAFVSLVAGASATPEDLIDHCKKRMAAYKYPRSVVLVEELPKTVTGKILRRELRTVT
ncbi:long-chain fatty acid--CoA ligase [Rhodococcus sp. IEGM 1379]|uniref:class I adenylate-forming enzyme family protein n=1 Tax=Rhodococcus sp. IEGM 1379 TaxID=3047086 RepID=UPI0024B784CA|nr:long-chain fatty acid--CoA ligase [Rhodococcus sp. IEGM 1379]MDI9917227.1 long-chain fatty acid--CoA ligase [Rhodococcus sp. IEGM 1379]